MPPRSNQRARAEGARAQDARAVRRRGPRVGASGDELPRAARRRNTSYQEAVVSELAAEQAAQLPVAASVRSDTDGMRKRSALSGGGNALSEVHRAVTDSFLNYESLLGDARASTSLVCSCGYVTSLRNNKYICEPTKKSTDFVKE